MPYEITEADHAENEREDERREHSVRLYLAGYAWEGAVEDPNGEMGECELCGFSTFKGVTHRCPTGAGPGFANRERI